MAGEVVLGYDGEPGSRAALQTAVAIAGAFKRPLVIAFGYWTYLARIVRGLVLSLKEREFVVAAKTLGVGHRAILRRHILPHLIPAIIVYSTLGIATSILIEASLSFLGLGIQPPDVSLGSLINSGQGDATALPWLFYFPAGILVIAILSVNFLGDGLRDALDPSQRVRA